MTKKWFHNWFSSPYYHILYHQRNDDEAEYFIDNLCALLKPDINSKLLDIACGRGIHSVYLNKKGYDVTGIDPSVSNIRFAQQFERENLHFYVHDMRYRFFINYFDFVFNLFSSFGHLDSERDHINALTTFNKSLKKDGILILDYFNTEKITRNLSAQEIKTIDGIDFYISKKVADGKIIKSISFEHKNKDYAFREEVKAFSYRDFERMFSQSGFTISHQFGDFTLNPFDENKSDRLIFICRKSDA